MAAVQGFSTYNGEMPATARFVGPGQERTSALPSRISKSGTNYALLGLQMSAYLLRYVQLNSARWSLLVFGLTVALLLTFAAVDFFFFGTAYEGGYYANVAIFRGSVFSCAAVAILLFAIVGFRQIPRLPKVGIVAIALIFVCCGIGVAPFVLKYAVRESCLNHHYVWNASQLLCEKGDRGF